MQTTEYDIEILSFIEQNSLINIIKVSEHTDSVINEIESNFTMGFSGIDWNERNIVYSQILNTNPIEYLIEAKKFLFSITKLYPHLLNEKISIIGDNLTNLLYEMTFIDFIDMSDLFLSIPQHTYIWFAASKKCINFTFENEAYFG